MHRFLAILERDLRKFIRNPLVVAISVLMPILYLVILGSSFQGELKNLPLAVVDLDNGPEAARVFELLMSIEAGPKTLKVYRLHDQGFALEGVRGGLFKAVLIVPENFSRRHDRGEAAALGLFLDNSDTVSARAIQGALIGALPSIKAEFIPVRGGEPGVGLSVSEIYRKIDYDQTLIPGVVIMAIFLGAMTTGAFNLVMDKFLGVEEGYFLTPLTKIDMVLGLVISGLIITTIIALAVLFFGSLISGMHLWSTLTFNGFFFVLTVIILSTLGLQGLMFVVMSRANHPRIVGVLGGFLNVMLFFPSGAIYPIESFPAWLKIFAKFNPETYSVSALKAILFKGAGFGSIQGDIAYLAAFAFFAIILGTITFKRSL